MEVEVLILSREAFLPSVSHAMIYYAHFVE